VLAGLDVELDDAGTAIPTQLLLAAARNGSAGPPCEGSDTEGFAVEVPDVDGVVPEFQLDVVAGLLDVLVGVTETCT
jgi:hypothetical protein